VKRKRSGLLYPDPVKPYPTICVTLEIPDEPTYRESFWGHIFELTHSLTWLQDSERPTGQLVEVRDYWLSLIWPRYVAYLRREVECPEMVDNCCPDPTRRVDSDGFVQVSYDNGQTYVPDPTDPRMGIIPLPPLQGPDGDEKRCKAATALAEGYKSATDQLLSSSGGWATVATLVELIISVLTYIFPGLGTVAALIISTFVFALWLIGNGALAAAMTAEVYHDLECIFYCRVGDDGTFNNAEWQSVKADIQGTFTGIAQFYLWNWTNALGPNGLNVLTRILPAGSVDCSDCECGTCRVDDVWQFNHETGLWFKPTPEGENTIILTSTTGTAREIIQVAFGLPYPDGKCCNIASWEQLSGNQIYIVDAWDCADQQTSGALPPGGCHKMVTIYSNPNPEPRQVWRLTLAEECV